MKNTQKYLFVWDCDFTISNEHTMFFPSKYIFGQETMNECKRLDGILYSKGHEYFLDLLKEKNIPNEKLLEAIDNIPLTPNIAKAFEVIRKNRNRCQSIILTSNLQLLSEEIMKHLKYDDVIDAYIGIRKVETKSYEHFKVYPGDIDNRCENCRPNPCKVNTFNSYVELNKIDYSGYTKVFICDGGNDLCFAKTLNENDYVFAREDFGLMKRLKRENNRNVIKAKLEVWKDGDKLSDLFQKLFE